MPEADTAIVRRFYEELWNRWDLAVADEIVAEDIRFRGSLGTTVRGRREFKAYVESVRTAFPDWRNEIEDLFGAGDKVVARLTWTGTHRGELLGVPATGREVAYAGAAIFTIADGVITDAWVVGDTQELWRALGLLAPQARPTPDDPGIDGFDYRSAPIAETAYRPGIAGAGPPVLLLHGFPQTHHCWHRIAPRLAEESTVVVCDLKGYGESAAPEGGPLGEGYSNRERAAELVELMAALGHERFAVVGHDRGARVAYRMALDHPDTVERLGVLNIVPTVDQFERMAEGVALEYYPWLLLAQPPPLAERLLAGAAEFFLEHTFDTWSADPDAIVPEARERYRRAFTDEAIARICADYRASFHIDRTMDAEDRDSGRRIRCPVLVHWGAEEGGMSDGPLEVWRRWADEVSGGPLQSGHFIPEEAAEELLPSLRSFLVAGG